LLNLICKDQFDASAGEDASMHLHDFCDICHMQKFKYIDNSIVKLKLFPVSLRGKAKEWLLALPNDSKNSWENLKEAFTKRYYPHVKFFRIEIAFLLLGQVIQNMLLLLGGVISVGRERH
jgi:hypothetical protein